MKTIRNSIWIVIFLWASISVNAQFIPAKEFTDIMKGYWEGAFIRTNSFQKFDMEVSVKSGELVTYQIMEEWFPTYGEFDVNMLVDSTYTMYLNTGYGQAALKLDPYNLEITGYVQDQNPTVYVHLKKAPKPPAEQVEVKPVTINSEGAQLRGHLHRSINSSKTAIILVNGRGCYESSTEYNLYAKFLRQYGITVLAYQKRGDGTSTGDCDKATIDDLANDVVAAQQYLQKTGEYEKIGVLGISAGGWTMLKAEEKTDFDFLISVVGPATSVFEQQMQSMKYGAEIYEIPVEAREDLFEYTKLMFEAKSVAGDFRKFQTLLENGKTDGWDILLEDTDIPNSTISIKDLWVQRHNYDPKTVLQELNKPYLAIYGETDWIVPATENIDALNTYFEDKRELLTTVVAYDSDHGMEMEEGFVELTDGSVYYHFYRVSPQVRIEIVKFLEKNGLIKS